VLNCAGPGVTQPEMGVPNSGAPTAPPQEANLAAVDIGVPFRTCPGIECPARILAPPHARRGLLWAFLTAALLPVFWAAIPAGANAQESYWGEKVIRIQIETDADIDPHSLARRILQQPGQPLDQVLVAGSLKNLFATGRFREMKALVRRQKGGVDLIFSGKARYFLGVVQVLEKPEAVAPAALASATRLRLGQPLEENDLKKAEDYLRQLLASNAYHRPRIDLTLSFEKQTQVVDVLIRIDPGPAAVLKKVVFEGNPLFPQPRLVRRAGLKIGRHITSSALEKGLTRLQQEYAKRGRLEAVASLAGRDYDPVNNTETLHIRVIPGPLVKIQVRGARISKSTLKTLLPTYTEGLTDDLSLATGAAHIRDYFQRQGYFEAAVHWSRNTVTGKGVLEIEYRVERGPRATFDGYAFKGNRRVPDEQLSSLMQIQPATFPMHRYGTFSQELLTEDVSAMQALYQSMGYNSATVTPKVKNSGGEVTVLFNIQEGPQTQVGKVDFQGVDSATARRFLTLIKGKPGSPYALPIARSDRDAILGDYSKRGYDHAVVTLHTSKESPDHKVDLTYAITPGSPVTIRRVVVLGNQHTRTGVINRRLTFKAGQPLDPSALFETQRRLYDVGVFNQVQVATQETGGDEQSQTVLVGVEEAHRWTVGYGGGLDVQRLAGNQPQGQFGASPRASLELTRADVGGRDQTFSINGRISNLETGAGANYVIPHFLNRQDLSFHLDALVDTTRDVLTFTSTIDQASVSIEKQYSPYTFLIGRYDYRLVKATNLRIQAEEVPLLSQPARIGTLGATFISDHRDDASDATRGSYSLLDASISAYGLGSQANYVRFLGQNSTYHRLGTHFIFARNTQLGVESTYGAVSPVAGIVPGDSSPIPLPERFFAGGSDSIRAFSLDQAGPRDPATGFPVGGNALFVNSFELRMPFFQGKYGVVLFNDAGNVYSGISSMRLLKFNQTSPLDLNYTVQAFGLGLRYKTPVGPVRIDMAYDVNPPRYQITQPILEVQQLPHLQFFLSIGQSF
jgi:outer membrane protein insertion porin family